MNTLNYNHLDAQKSAKIVIELQNLLADYQIHYANLRGFHWNITGRGFFQLHAKFEELYGDAAEKVDEIAERILMLGDSPKNNYSDYIKVSKIQEISGVCCDEQCLQSTLDGISMLIERERVILAHANDAGDDSTATMMGDYIMEQEKLVWMLVAYFKDSCQIKG